MFRKSNFLILGLLLAYSVQAQVDPSRVTEVAEAFEGVPYQFGARRPNTEDCSSVIQKVFGALGVQLPRASYEQASDPRFIEVSTEDLRAGDLVFFANTWRKGISHVGLMLDSTTMLHGSPRHHSVYRTQFDEHHPLWRKIQMVRRLRPEAEVNPTPHFSWDGDA